MSEFATAALSYVGTPFQHQGRNRAGIDCAGLTVCAARDVGRYVEDFRAYPRVPRRGELRRKAIEVFGAPLTSEDQWSFGNVCLFRTKLHPHHIGILCPHPDYKWGIVHACGNAKKVIHVGFDATMRRNLVHVLPGII